MIVSDFEKKLALLEEVKADEIDTSMLSEVIADDEFTPLEEVRSEREFSGKVLVRIPKELHRSLVEKAQSEGVSLNQYCLYKLARN